jgi:hypothetical protein
MCLFIICLLASLGVAAKKFLRMRTVKIVGIGLGVLLLVYLGHVACR